MRVLVSTSFHEHLGALSGFHLNWRAALSGRMVTLAHLSATTRYEMLAEMAAAGVIPSGEGLLINPVSIPTQFGTALPMMMHNHRVAEQMGLEFSHIMMASPYLYAFVPGLDVAIGALDAGLPANMFPMHAGWHWHDAVMSDPRLHAMASYLGTPLQCGRADGVFMTRDLFQTMVALLLRFFAWEELVDLHPMYPLEEVLFPTLLPALLGDAGRIGPTRARVWELGDPPTAAKVQAAIQSGLHVSGKRIPQNPFDPLRRLVLANLPGEAMMNACLGGFEDA